MNRRATTFLAWSGTVVCAVAVLSACSGSKKPVSSGSVSSASSVVVTTPASPAPKPKPKPVPPVNPLNGVGAPSSLPVVAVKVDDTAPGRPQVAIDQADIVYIEQAEGGLSRLVAVYGTKKPVVGYVRSTRPSDPELLLQYGKITLVASGGGGDALVLLDRSGLNPWINDRGAPYFNRVSRYESDYINLTIDVAKVSATVKSAKPRSIGFTWSTGYGKVTPSVRGRVVSTLVGSTPVSFHWDSVLKKYVRYIDGAPQFAADGRPVATPNVIIQNCIIKPHYGDVDVNGNPSQYTYTVGKGAVTVLRNGHSIRGTWSRASVNSGTILRDAKGSPIPLAPGGAWVVLVGNGAPVALG